VLVRYARVTTRDQSPARQLDALKAADCERIVEETASGAKRERPELLAVLTYMRAGDTLVVWTLDRFARSTRQLIEAKITEDDGTARDKITRVQHLGSLSMQGRAPTDPPRFELVACITGRGFKVRREDMKKLLLATRGKLFTLQNLAHLVECTRLAEFRTRTPAPRRPRPSRFRSRTITFSGFPRSASQSSPLPS